MLHRAIEMAESLGIVNHSKLVLQRSQLSDDMITSVKRTAWGLFQVDTYVILCLTGALQRMTLTFPLKQDCPYKFSETEPRESSERGAD